MLTLLINGVDFTEKAIPETMLMNAQAQNGCLTIFDVYLKGLDGTYEVDGGSIVELYLDGNPTPLFRGVHTRTFPGRYAANGWQYLVRSTSYEQVFGFKQLFTAFRGVTFEQAVNQILNDPGQQFPTNLIRTVKASADLSQAMPFYAVNGAFPSEIFNLISNFTGALWRINSVGPDLELEFFDPFTTYSGFELTENNNSFRWSKFEPSINLEAVINTQTVRGSQTMIDTETQAFFRGDNLSSQFNLPTTPYNNAASIVVWDTFATQNIQSANWFELDISGDYVYADGDGYIQFEPPIPNAVWIGLISTGLAYRSEAISVVFDITWIGNGPAMIGLTTMNAVPGAYEQFLEAGFYIDGTGHLFGVAGGAIAQDTGITLTEGNQYRLRLLLEREHGCVGQLQQGADIYSRNWPTVFESEAGDATALAAAVVVTEAQMNLAMVKMNYPYMGIRLEVDRGNGFLEETVGVGQIDEDVDAVIVEESTLAFFGSDPGPSSIPPKPDWQDDPDYKNIRVTYRRGVDIFVTYTDPQMKAIIAALVGNGDSGIREGPVINDASITSFSAGFARARTEVKNKSNLIDSIQAETSMNILRDANVSFPRVGESSRYDITMAGTGYSIQRDIPLRRVIWQAKQGANDFAIQVEAGYLDRGLRTVLQSLLDSGRIISINENQVIYQSALAQDDIDLVDEVTVLSSNDTNLWGDERLDRNFTVNTGTDVLTTTTTGLFETGDRVLSFTDGVLPVPLLEDVGYYVHRITGTTYYLYDSVANAIAGGATGRIDFSTTGSGTHTLSIYGWRYGQHAWGSFAKTTLSGTGVLKASGRIL